MSVTGSSFAPTAREGKKKPLKSARRSQP
jgi:hypothetical protein